MNSAQSRKVSALNNPPLTDPFVSVTPKWSLSRITDTAVRRFGWCHMCSPHCLAIASTSVDLPDPFSPTRKVTLWLKVSFCLPWRGPMLKG